MAFLFIHVTAGSKYAQTGMFEVTKAEEEPTSSTSPPPSPGVNPQSGKPSTALRVTVPSELQGVAYIEVLCQKGKTVVTIAKYSHYWSQFKIQTYN